MKHTSATAYLLASRRSRRQSITVTFQYDPADPFAVTLLLESRGKRVKWMFARELLADGRLGIEGPGGDVTVSPAADPRKVLIDLCSPSGHSVLWIDDKAVLEFLTATYELVPAGTETDRINWARELPILLDHWWSR